MININNELLKPEYEFLKTNPKLSNTLFLGLGGSHAYGTNIATSDVDIRGIAMNSKYDIFTDNKFEQVCDSATDTTIYSLDKIFKLWTNCNPNTIEMLGLEENQYIATEPMRIILDNKTLFLSKVAAYSFGGYAVAQLRRLENKSVHHSSQSKKEKHILDSIINASYDMRARYEYFNEGDIKLYIDKSNKPDFEDEIYCSVNIDKYPLRDLKDLCSEAHSIISSYDKLGIRNSKAIEHGKINKHMMHLVRLYLMACDILENKLIKTYRDKDHDLLMNIRNGKFTTTDNEVLPEFYDMVNDLEKRFNYAKENADLPDKPNYKDINNLLYGLNSTYAR